MVKQSLACMRRFFSSERFGRPQFFAALLLLAFVGECAWLVAHEFRGFVTSENEFVRIEGGLAQWTGQGIAGTPPLGNPLEPAANTGALYDRLHSPLWYLIASAPVAAIHVSPDSSLWLWLTRAPYVIFGTLLGASLWYVARRLYGDAGGYIALALYCFSPAVLRSSVLWVAEPNIGGTWGTFGAVFTAIAVTHTLYAPREVVLWNWRRIVLLGISLTLAVGSQFGLVVILPVLLGFMLYLTHERKLAAIIILLAAGGLSLLLLLASYFFHAKVFFQSVLHARLLDLSWRSVLISGDYVQFFKEIAESGPVLVLLIPVSFATYIAWRRTRYFGNTAPLIVAGLFVTLRLLSPHVYGSVFSLTAVVFLLVFVAGIAADLLETKAREPVMAVFTALIAANALWDLRALAQLHR